MSDVILIYPALGRTLHLRPPLGILTLASWLIPKGYTVKIIDQRVDLDWKEILTSEITEDTICIGISSMSGYQIEPALEVCKFIRKISGAPIVWGGVHPTIESKTTIGNEFVDIVVIGEGDITFPELLNCLKYKKDLNDVRGIAFVENGHAVYTPQREAFDLNTLPSMRFDIIDLNKYRDKDDHYELEGDITLSIETSKGCSHRCGFCAESRRLYKWRGMKPEKIVKEIKKIINRYGINTFTIVDDNFFVDQTRAEKFCDLLIKEKIDIEWYTNCRPDYVARYDASFLKKLRQAGCKCLTFGAESGSNRILKLIQKGATKEQMLLTNRKMRDANIVPWFVTISGFPYDDLESVKETYLMIIKLMKENPTAKSGVEPLIPTPGAMVTEECYKHGFERPKNLYEWSKIRTRTDWVKKEALDFLKQNGYLLDLISLRNQKVFLSSITLRIYSTLLERRIKNNYFRFFIEPKIVKSMPFTTIMGSLSSLRL